MSISLVAVFIPILLMGGIVGRLFREFAVTLSVAIAVSLLVSLIATPMMCALFLRHEHGKHGRLYRFAEHSFDRLVRTYDVCLRWVLRHQFLTLLIILTTVALNVDALMIVPKGFFPQQDTGASTVSCRAIRTFRSRRCAEDGSVRGHRATRSCGGHGLGLHRRRQWHQYRTPVHAAQAEKRTKIER